MRKGQTIPDVNRDDFTTFLSWLVEDDPAYEQSINLIGVVEKPWHFEDEYIKFLAEQRAES